MADLPGLNATDVAYNISDSRREAMVEGMQILRSILDDLMSTGLASAAAQPISYWRDLSDRMIDCKLRGVANKLDAIGLLIQSDADWPQKVLARIASLYLLTTSFDRVEEFPPALRAEIYSACGINASRKALSQLPGLKDHWLMIREFDGNNEKVNYRTTWFLGLQSGQVGYLMDYAYGFGEFEYYFQHWSVLDAEIVFYPGAHPRRILMKEGYSRLETSPPIQAPRGLLNLNAMQEFWEHALASSPWIDSVPFIIENIRVVMHNEAYYLTDETGQIVPMHHGGYRLEDTFTKTLRSPGTMIGELRSDGITPFAIW